MNRREYLQITSYIGVALIFLGLGWFFGRRIGEVNIKLSTAMFITIGLILIVISFAPKK